MNVVACAAPIGMMEPAPITSLAIHMDWDGRRLSAFWTADGEYVVRAERDAAVDWYRIDAEMPAPAGDEEARRALGAMLADIIPLGGDAWRSGGQHRPPGLSRGRSSKGAGAGRTRILGVRAARSRRLPA